MIHGRRDGDLGGEGGWGFGGVVRVDGEGGRVKLRWWSGGCG